MIGIAQPIGISAFHDGYAKKKVATPVDEIGGATSFCVHQNGIFYYFHILISPYMKNAQLNRFGRRGVIPYAVYLLSA